MSDNEQTTPREMLEARMLAEGFDPATGQRTQLPCGAALPEYAQPKPKEQSAKAALPEKFTRDGHAIEAARLGMSDRAIAARAGKLPRDWAAFLVAFPDLALKIQLARAEYEESKRKKRELAAEKAAEEGNWSLVYKEAHDAVKELNERDKPTAVFTVQPQDNGLALEPDYVEHSEEELAAIRAATESEADRNE